MHQKTKVETLTIVTIEIEENGCRRMFKMPEWMWNLLVKFYTDSDFRLPFKIPTFHNFLEYLRRYPHYVVDKGKNDVSEFVEYSPFVFYPELAKRDINPIFHMN